MVNFIKLRKCLLYFHSCIDSLYFYTIFIIVIEKCFYTFNVIEIFQKFKNHINAIIFRCNIAQKYYFDIVYTNIF